MIALMQEQKRTWITQALTEYETKTMRIVCSSLHLSNGCAREFFFSKWKFKILSERVSCSLFFCISLAEIQKLLVIYITGNLVLYVYRCWKSVFIFCHQSPHGCDF